MVVVYVRVKGKGGACKGKCSGGGVCVLRGKMVVVCV